MMMKEFGSRKLPRVTFVFAVIVSMATVVVPAAAPAWAGSGAVSGGGGKTVVCRNPQTQEILSAELLDLYEGRLLYRRQILNSLSPVETQVREALSKTSLDAKNHYTESALRFGKVLNFLGSDIQLLEIDDAVEVALPRLCKLEQTVNFVNPQAILVSKEIWEKLDATNRAALLVHEAIYKHERDFASATDSRRTRNIVSMLFSSERDRLEDPLLGIPAGHVQKCTASTAMSGFANPAFEFYVYPVNGRIVLQFTVVGSQERLSRTLVQTELTAELKTYSGHGEMDAYSVSQLTQGEFESGDQIFVEFSGWETATISGISGWIPGLKFQPTLFSCRTR